MAEARKVPLVNIVRADLRATTTALNRIADALEAYLLIEHGYAVRKPVAPHDDGEEKPSLEYYTDLGAAKQEVEDAMKGSDADEEDVSTTPP